MSPLASRPIHRILPDVHRSTVSFSSNYDFIQLCVVRFDMVRCHSQECWIFRCTPLWVAASHLLSCWPPLATWMQIPMTIWILWHPLTLYYIILYILILIIYIMHLTRFESFWHKLSNNCVSLFLIFVLQHGKHGCCSCTCSFSLLNTARNIARQGQDNAEVGWEQNEDYRKSRANITTCFVAVVIWTMHANVNAVICFVKNCILLLYTVVMQCYGKQESKKFTFKRVVLLDIAVKVIWQSFMFARFLVLIQRRLRSSKILLFSTDIMKLNAFHPVARLLIPSIQSGSGRIMSKMHWKATSDIGCLSPCFKAWKAWKPLNKMRCCLNLFDVNSCQLYSLMDRPFTRWAGNGGHDQHHPLQRTSPHQLGYGTEMHGAATRLHYASFQECVGPRQKRNGNEWHRRSWMTMDDDGWRWSWFQNVSLWCFTRPKKGASAGRCAGFKDGEDMWMPTKWNGEYQLPTKLADHWRRLCMSSCWNIPDVWWQTL